MLPSGKNTLSKISRLAAFTSGLWLFAHDLADRIIHSTIDAAARRSKPGLLDTFLLETSRSSQRLRDMAGIAGLATKKDIEEVDDLLERIAKLLQD